jgi:hypothetical protein
VLLVVPSARAATSLALLPSTGAAAAEQRRALDTALRKALQGEDDLDLQSAAETAEQIAMMAELGSSCSADDRDCLQKLGIIASVDRLLVVEARGKRTLQVKLTLLDVGDGAVLHTAEGMLVPADDGDVAALVGRLFGRGAGDDDDGQAAPPTTPVPRYASPPAALDQAVDESALRGGALAGAITAGVGGGIGGLALLGALIGEGLLATDTGDRETRAGAILPTTQALWVVTLVGAATAGVGAGLLLLGPGAPAPDDGA